MTDLFKDRVIRPMLIGADSEPFDNPGYLVELKWDGERCLAYLDPKQGTELRNKRNIKMLPKVPELADIHKQVKAPCILDGELVVLRDGKPAFAEIQRRSLMSNQFKIELAARKYPATFLTFDVLHHDGQETMGMPLEGRKELLRKVVTDGERMAASRFVDGQVGRKLYHLAEEQDLEGVVAKKLGSIYIPGKRTKDWVKIKNLQDDDFVVCGWIPKDNHMTSIVLGQYRGNVLAYKGHVTLGVGGEAFAQIKAQETLVRPPLEVPDGHGNEAAHWIEPNLVCTVKYMQKTKNGGMRQPVFKGLREDKKAQDCTEGGA